MDITTNTPEAVTEVDPLLIMIAGFITDYIIRECENNFIKSADVRPD